MANRNFKYFILTGDPGVGKTTLTKKIASLLNGKGIKTVGFYTEEVRNNRGREGFDVVGFDGTRARLARVQHLLDLPVKYKLGNYGVLINEFESVALPCLEESEGTRAVLVIDEIGKMEFFSEQFKAKIKNIFCPNSDYVVLATIPKSSKSLLIESIRNHNQAKVWRVTRMNRNTIHEDVFNEIKLNLNFN